MGSGQPAPWYQEFIKRGGQAMNDLKEHPDVLRIQKYGYAKKPVPECFPKPKAVELFEDLEDDLKWDIRRYRDLVNMYRSHNLLEAMREAESALNMLRDYLENVREMKKSAHKE